MMATNVTQKDATLKDVIYFCKERRDDENKYTVEHLWLGDTILTWNRARVQAYDDIIAYCESMFGYSGSMPLEVENQSEDAKMEAHHA